MGDLTLQHVVLRICAALLISAVHGFAVAGMSCLLGDEGPRHDSRLGIGPWQHADPIGGLLMVFFTLGWIRPIAVDPGELRSGRLGLLAVVLGGSGATLLLAVLARLVRPFVLNVLADTEAATFFVFVETLGQLCVSFTLFNLLPLPVLTGQHLLVAIVPAWRDTLTRSQPYVAVALALLVATGMPVRLFAPAQTFLLPLVLGDWHVARLDPRHFAVAAQAVHCRHDRSFQGQIAFPQPEHERVTNQLGRHPADGQSTLSCQLHGQQTFRDTGIETSLLHAVDQFRAIADDRDLRLRRAEPGRQRNTIEAGRRDQDTDPPAA
jgi:Zn-dependent protease